MKTLTPPQFRAWKYFSIEIEKIKMPVWKEYFYLSSLTIFILEIIFITCLKTNL